MPRRTIELRLPLVQLPDKLPGEDMLSRGVDKVLNLVERDPVLNTVNRVIEKIPIIREKSVSTPLGSFKTPEFYVPRLIPARMDARIREAFKAAALVDASSLISKIPWMGAAAAPVSDAVEDTAYAKIHDTLTPEEDTFFTSYDKADPLSTIAMLRTMVRIQKER